MPPTISASKRHFPFVAILGVATLILVIVGGALVARQALTPTPQLPANFAQLNELATFAPRNSDLFFAARISVLDSILASAHQLLPEVFTSLDAALTQVSGHFGQFETLALTGDWLGENAALSLFPDAGDASAPPRFVLVAQISDREKALNALSGAVGISSQTQETVNGMTHYHLTDGLDLLLTDQLVALTNGYDQIPSKANQPTFVSNPQLAQLFVGMTFSRYDLLTVVDTTSAWWASAQTVFPSNPQAAQPYLGLAIAQPEAHVTLIDLSQTGSSALLSSSQTNDTLLPLIPATSLTMVQTTNLAALQNRLLASQWSADQLPGLPQTIGLINQVVMMATGMDYQKDFVSQMTGSVVLYIDTPGGNESPGTLTWGLVIQANDPSTMRATFDRAAFQLPLRVALVRPLLSSVFPDLQFDIRTESLSGQNAITVDLGGSAAADLLMTTLNDGKQLLIGDRAGVLRVMDRTAGATFDYGRYLPYTVKNATLSAIINVETLVQSAQLLSANGIPISSDEIARQLDGVANNVYVGMVVSDNGMEFGSRGAVSVIAPKQRELC